MRQTIGTTVHAKHMRLSLERVDAVFGAESDTVGIGAES
jgi:hypothetical protein